MKDLINKFEDAVHASNNKAIAELFDAILIELHKDSSEDNKYLVSELLNRLDYSDDEIEDLLSNA
jgi:hypothetical protein